MYLHLVVHCLYSAGAKNFQPTHFDKLAIIANSQVTMHDRFVEVIACFMNMMATAHIY